MRLGRLDFRARRAKVFWDEAPYSAELALGPGLFLVGQGLASGDVHDLVGQLTGPLLLLLFVLFTLVASLFEAVDKLVEGHKRY